MCRSNNFIEWVALNRPKLSKTENSRDMSNSPRCIAVVNFLSPLMHLKYAKMMNSNLIFRI